MGSLMNQVFYTDAYDLSIVSLIVAVFAVAIVAWVVWELAQVILRHMIGKEYSVRVPFSVRVGLNRRHSPDGFSMGYPYWQAAKKGRHPRPADEQHAHRPHAHGHLPRGMASERQEPVHGLRFRERPARRGP